MDDETAAQPPERVPCLIPCPSCGGRTFYPAVRLPGDPLPVPTCERRCGEQLRPRSW
jgi:hypothetical protein